MIAFHVNLDHHAISLSDTTDKLTLVVNVMKTGDGILCLWTLLRRADVVDSGECSAGINSRENRSLFHDLRISLGTWENAVEYENDGSGGLATLCQATMCGGLVYEACLDDVIDWIADQSEYL